MGYRGLEKESADCLKDTIESWRINGENAGTYASEVMYLAASLLTGQQEYVRIEEPEEYRDIQLKMKGIKRVNGMRNTNPTAYAYMVKSFQMLQEAGLYIDSII